MHNSYENIDNEINCYKLKIKECENKLFQVEKTIGVTKILQEKAKQVIEKNQLNNKDITIEINNVNVNYNKLINDNNSTTIEKKITVNDLLEKIGKLTNKKNHIENVLKRNNI